MSARHKLNVAYLNGALVVAFVIGAVCESLAVFLVALVVLVGCGLHAGDIRPGRPRW